MPDTALIAEPAREELLLTAEEALARLAPALPPTAGELLRALFQAVPSPELAAMPAEAMAEAAASLYGFAEQRQPGQAKLRLLPPGPGRGPRAVVEIVTDDMPFLVDSALAALAQQGRLVQQLLHPVVRVRRDAAGRLLGFSPEGAAESMMRITLAAAPAAMLPGSAAAPGDWPAVEAALDRALADVRLAVGDFEPMMTRLRGATEEVRDPVAASFLRWLAEDNFVLLGHRRLDVAADGGVSVDPAENLGLLRDAALPVFDPLRDLGALSPAMRAAFQARVPVSIAKANMRSTVHRPQHADVIATRVFGAGGQVVAIRLFLGLFAAAAYNRNPRSIPLLAQKVDRILAAAGYDPEAHDGRALRNILDTWPRDELFQAPEAEILAAARRALELQIRPRPALVIRRDPFGRFVSAIAWLPRDTFDTRLRERVGEMLARANGGHLSAFYIALGDGPLARVHYIIGTDPRRPVVPDEAALEAVVAQAARGFQDRLAEALGDERGEAEAALLLSRWRDAFPAPYRDGASGAQGAADLALAERALAEGRPAMRVERTPGAVTLTLRLASPGGPLALAEALPLFESLDLKAIEEVPYRLTPAGAPPVVLHVFALEPRVACENDHFPLLLEALAALLAGRAEADGFNRLVLRAGLSWRECWLLRAMFRWLKQVGFAFAQASVEEALAANPRAAALLLALFRTRFAPEITERDEAAPEAEWRALLDAVANPDEDRILSRLRQVLDAMLRTNYFLDRPWLSFKLDSAAAGEMPAPRPWREIFVHSPRMEGVHLRAGPVARGGIRWSDRREDFRTEILGLMKAQRVKNVVIVPTGAKGGFILKHIPEGREAFQAEGTECYRILVRGMLDITDNLKAGAVVPPAGVVRRDSDDPYLVVAADKGTARFSDLANALAAEYGFWLGDAFASGGSAGYDHKGMGITARGAWVMIARHFAELGQDIFATPFTCVGVGDMSGDVFGNGLLISRQTRLLAAFDHRHIFLDPDPDPAVSYEERARLFALPGSSWADYDPGKISAGGGVFPRNARHIPLSPQVRAALGLSGERAEPAEVMRAILRAPADLLYFGGIGTYVKASGESQAEVGDRANDPVRVDGRDIRVRVVGEGANLGMTQAGRIEAARAGVRLNTDALDNSAGVSTSDHEVNIKILLADAEAEGALTRRQRDELLKAMTEEVAALVLRDNNLQSLAVSLEALEGAAALPAQAALMTRLEADGLLDRAVAGLPDATAMQARIGAGQALTRPEIAALLPLAKLWLTEALEASALPDDPAFLPLLMAYFPEPLRQRFPALIARHRLRRELVATALANMVANRLGNAELARLLMRVGPAAAGTEGPVMAVRAAWLADAAFGLEAADEAVDRAPAPAARRLEALLALRRLQSEAAEGLTEDAPLEATLALLRPGIAALLDGAPRGDAGGETGGDAAFPPEVARLVAAAPRLGATPAIVRLAAGAGVPPGQAAAAWTGIGEALGIEPLRQAVQAAPAQGSFGPRIRMALLEDLATTQYRLAAARLAGRRPAAEPAAQAAARLAQEAVAAGGLAALGVGVRAFAALA